MEVKFKVLNQLAMIPKYAHDDDSGMDLYAVSFQVMINDQFHPELSLSDCDCSIVPGGRALIKTGLSIELPQGTEAQIRSRSGLALKQGLFVLNSPGTIDEGYRGEIGVILCNTSSTTKYIKSGDRVAQLVIAPVLRPTISISNDLSETDRGSGGFGSTGVNDTP